MKTGYSALLLMIIFLSCNQTQEKTQPDPVTDSVPVKNPTDTILTGYIDTALAGIYQAVLPCTGCENRLHTVMLNADGTFRLEEEFIGKGLGPSVTRGTWQRHKNEVKLNMGNVALFTYPILNDSLKIAGPLSENDKGINYPLNKMPSNKHTAWLDKWKSGVDFFGIGTEPFWSISIQNKKQVILKFAGREQPIIVEAPTPSDYSDSIVYVYKGKGSQLRVTIYPLFCNDGMSDFLYEQSVHVIYDGLLLKGCGRFRE